MIASLIRSLALTLGVELAVALALGLRSRRGAAVVALMNVTTNPPVVFTLSLARKLIPRPACVALTAALEAGAWALEALVLHRCLDIPPKRALALSAGLNLCSYLAGVLASRL